MYIIEKHYRLTDEVRKFKAMTKAEAERIFFSFTHGKKNRYVQLSYRTMF